MSTRESPRASGSAELIASRRWRTEWRRERTRYCSPAPPPWAELSSPRTWDFLAIAADWIKSRRPFGGVIFASQMRITIGQAIADIELLAKALNPDDLQNQIIHVPLK